ncbi:P-loop containing nucleoside triphosphate hydrolase protein [Pseudomassariella vexata]|uniref:Kinesin-like protein n=1 Tax=Pseudomassariella vexata TaxID=1141098 RepID=A0A1Y2DUJ0_9PEZI|nr:P-loop containing nucleoside triphosphate hydrolase protein [Pseudomassariella vexata]ORY62907.1 P-loop containing nucleoside triphosphate hydrolase protein [Pseudomassariella vexata]
MSGANSIKVVARFRPQNKVELASGGQPIVKFDGDDTCAITSAEAQGSFTFDRVFDMKTAQSDIFDYSIKPTVDDILNGYNGTVFAYGQTGAGKSYTMMGTSIEDDEGKGVTPRIVEQIFSSIMSSPGTIEYTVRVSYMEIYMERIRDLLQPQNDNLPVHEEKNRGVYVKGLLEIYVSSVQEVFEVMRRGGNARAVAATNMNQESSRSHSIFVITITQKNVETGSAKSGQLFLVDLAGSEKVGKTGASGQTLEEAKKINKSLSALGMVINALTDGRSSHIPYRDSKLTRILQESLGGNSRTTLIINCSPSSYNDAETLSTLRFGMRAKSIKNKAKVNAELSPAELKAMLKKAQTSMSTFENYISNLEGEIQLWRAGEAVPKERWTPAMSEGVVATKADARPARPSTPSRLITDSRSETPALTERAGTPGIPLDKDEREEFLRRENELQDQLSEKESQVVAAEKSLAESKDELSFLKEHDSKLGKENEKLTTEVNEAKMQLERIAFESKEAQITMDALKEANSELTTELDEVKQQLLDVKMSAKETSAVLDEKEKKKAEKMAKMMAGFDLGGDVFSENERTIAQAIQHVEALYEQSSAGDPIPPDDISDLKARLVETQGIIRQAELSLYSGISSDSDARRRQELETRLEVMQRDYEELLTRNLSDADVEEVKERLKEAYANKQTTQMELVDELKADIAQKAAENARMKTLIDDLQIRIKSGAVAAPGLANGKTIQQQIAEFDVMKKSLMRDLQNRCERVVELEISLDETREQYNNVLRSSNNRAQQKKMAFLERNLEQLTQVQRQLVEQNGALKKEVAIAERKLIARNERIQSLESLLQDSQEKLTAANHRFESQLTAVKERLEAAKAGSTRGLNSPTGNGGFSFGSRIAKPLRGGGEAAPAQVPTITNLQNESGAGNKRSSWFFQKS